MKEIRLDDLRKIQINILNLVVQFCEEKGLEYFLTGGTLIGAIRHKGYIPWDDDIDISLLRKDYDRFISEFNGFSKDYKVINHDNTTNYPFPYAKVMFKDTILIEPGIDPSLALGVNIDVFPIDKAPKAKNELNRILRRIKINRGILNVKLIKWDQERPFYKNLILYILKVIFVGKNVNKVAKNITKIALSNRNNESNKAGILVWGYGQCEVVDSSIFKDTEKKIFEGKYYNVPSGYHKWLTSIYGDYMSLPPIEKQVSHHDFIAYWK